MEWAHIIWLAIIQGITEFLPISSSAHLILPKELLGWPDQGLAFDLAVHCGSLVAVLVYFRQDLHEISRQSLASLQKRRLDKHTGLVFNLAIATFPVCLVGLLVADFIEANFRSMVIIALATIVFGLVLGFSEKLGSQKRELYQLTLAGALVIGFAQALALIPGTSRSGITISAALLLGLTAKDAARFSFLLSIPVISLGGMLKAVELVQSSTAVDWTSLAAGVALSAISAYFCIKYFLAFIERIGMMPFVIYRLLLGGGLLALFFIRAV